MVLWITMAALAALALAPVLWALARSADGSRADPALAIYRDQLDEVDRDAARGVIGEAEAGAARNEIARRLIRAGEREPRTPPHHNERNRRFAAVAVGVMPLAALGLYLSLGSPELPDQPLAARLTAPPESQDIATLVVRVERHLAANPDDGTGWEVLAPVYLRLGRPDAAIEAFSETIRLLGATAEREANLGEALVVASLGQVTEEARAAFERAADLAPDDPRPKFYLALGLGQEGRRDEAIAAWHALLDGAPPNAGWVDAARAELARLEAADGGGALGPTAADIEGAAGLPPEERLAMIEGMVASLAARLEADPDDADGWARLIRSYMVLDRPDDARAALTRARAAVLDDMAKQQLIEAAAREAGLAP